MKALALLLSLFLTLNSSFAFDCADEFVKEAKNLLALDHQNLLGLQFKLTTLKLSREVVEGGNTTLEEVIKNSSEKIKRGDPKVLKELENLYQKHGKAVDHKKILENFSRASYWNKKLRFYNEDISLFILAKQTLDPADSDLGERDAAIAWLASKMSDMAGPKNSSSYNHTNLSTQVASLSGAMKGISAKNPEEIKKSIEEVTQKMAEGFKHLKEDLSQSFKEQCLYKNNPFLPCLKEDELLSQAFRELARSVGSEKTYQFMWKEAIVKKLGGQLAFKLESNLKTHVEEISKLKVLPEKSTQAVAHEGFLDYQKNKNWQAALNALPDGQKIKAYYQQMGTGPYAILDKSKRAITLHSKEGEVLATLTTEVAKSHLDTHQKPGIYTLSKMGKDLTLVDERGKTSELKLGKRALECADEECLEELAPQELLKKYLTDQSKLYILPYDEAHHFEVKNSVLNFTTDKKEGPFPGLNFSPKGTRASPIKIDITNPLYDTPSAREFLKVLEDEKANLMKLYNLDNDEYNDLAVYAFGIMGNESEFGQGIEYKIKEGAPLLVTLVKKITGNTSYNSRGFTQIKQVPELIKKKYGVTPASLKVPVNSALATMGFLAEAMEELKIRAKNKSYITKDNRMDYLHYIYLGDRQEITNDTATPEFSIYANNRKKYSEGITLYQLP